MRTAIRKTDPFTEAEVKHEPRRIRLPSVPVSGILTAILFACVAWVGAELAYSMAQPPMDYLASLQARRTSPIATPHMAAIWTPSPVPTATETPTPTPTSIALPKIPKWFTETTMIKFAGIVSGETWSITDTVAMEFIATQIFYDALRNNGWLPAGRWKAYKQPTHLTLQAVNVALMHINDPKWPKCAFIGGYNDGDYFARVSKYTKPDYSFGSGKHVVEGWGCKS